MEEQFDISIPDEKLEKLLTVQSIYEALARCLYRRS